MGVIKDAHRLERHRHASHRIASRRVCASIRDARVVDMSTAGPRGRDGVPSASYVSRDGAMRARAPISPVGLVWGAVGIVDAFVRTLLIEGYAETYAANGRARGGGRGGVGVPGRVAVHRGSGGGGGGVPVRGFANVRTVDHSAPAAGG